MQLVAFNMLSSLTCTVPCLYSWLVTCKCAGPELNGLWTPLHANFEGADSNGKLIGAQLHAGGMAVMTAALRKSKDAAWGPAMLLSGRLSKEFMPCDCVNLAMAQLAELQGVLEVTRLLCPDFQDGKDLGFALGKKLRCMHANQLVAAAYSTRHCISMLWHACMMHSI